MLSSSSSASALKVASILTHLALGVSIGFMLIPTVSHLTKTPFPGGDGNGCAQLLNSKLALWMGIPVGVLGLSVVALIWFAALFQKTMLLARSMSFAAASYASLLLFWVYQNNRIFCGSMMALVGCLVLAGSALLFVQKLSLKGIALVGLASCLPMILAASVRIPVPEWEANEIRSVPRRDITNNASSASRQIVVFASPSCPTCEVEIPSLLRKFHGARFLTIRFAPLTNSIQEKTLAAYGSIAQARHRPDVVAIVYSKLEPPLRLAIVSRMLRPSRAEMLSVAQSMKSDQIVGSALRLTRIPTIIDCPPDSSCVVVDALK